MDKAKLISVYDATAEAYDEKFSAPSKHIDKFLGRIKPAGNILDLGCGAGNNAVFLAQKGYNVTGVDLSDEMLARARNKKSPAKFLKMDMEELDFPSDTFDHIIAAYSLCYLPKTKVPACLEKLHDILKKDGLVFIKIGEGTPGEITRTTSVGKKLDYDFNVMSEDEIRGLLKNAGFEVLETYSDENSNKAHTNLRDFCIIAKTTK